MVEEPSKINALFIFDLNRISDLDHPSDKDVQVFNKVN